MQPKSECFIAVHTAHLTTYFLSFWCQIQSSTFKITRYGTHINCMFAFVYSLHITLHPKNNWVKPWIIFYN